MNLLPYIERLKDPALAAKQEKANWRSAYTAVAANAWIREGFQSQ